MKQYQPKHRHQFKILKCVKDAVNCFKSIKVIRTLASLTLWIPGCYIWKWTDCLSVNLLCLCFHSFYCCLSSFLPFSLLCPWDGCLSRVLDEDFYKQPFSELIGYVYVAPTNIPPLRLPLFFFSPLSFIPSQSVFDIVTLFPCFVPS